MNRYEFHEYRVATRDVTCSRCGLDPQDLPDEHMINDGWREIFEYVEEDRAWTCMGCLER